MQAPSMIMRAAILTMALGAAAGCGGNGSGGDGSAPTGAPQSTVNFVVSDTPSTGITVLSFQIQITAAVLQPGNISILPKPVTVDLAQLVSDTGFLASTVIDSGTYTSLALSYANPQVTIQNDTGSDISLPGGSCAAGATCTFTPALDNATLTVSSGIFPLTLTASSSTGLNLDLSIADLLQSDLSIRFASGSSVNLSLLGSGPVRIDDVLATVTSASDTQIGVTTAFGDSLVLAPGTSSAYDFPSSVCASNDVSCVMSGQAVALDVSLGGDGTLTIDSLSYLGASGTPLVKALVLSAATGAAPSGQLLLLRGINVSSLTPGQIATVSFAPGASYSVATASYPSVANARFAGAGDLLPGQELIVGVSADLVAGSSPTFTTSAVYLQSSQIVGDVASVDGASSEVMIDSLTGLFTASGLHIQAIDAQTDSGTELVGFGALSSLAAGQLVVATGPLLAVAGSTTPAIAAVQIRSLN
ncbi:MAG TPA: hypothetical protein VME42_12725 [Steroidobacteraceae bacterium]|nr:hypothetical protein [Steroidobacteraceae bacterium]